MFLWGGKARDLKNTHQKKTAQPQRVFCTLPFNLVTHCRIISLAKALWQLTSLKNGSCWQFLELLKGATNHKANFHCKEPSKPWLLYLLCSPCVFHMDMFCVFFLSFLGFTSLFRTSKDTRLIEGLVLTNQTL